MARALDQALLVLVLALALLVMVTAVLVLVVWRRRGRQAWRVAFRQGEPVHAG
jgi:hypothetical protein